MASQLSKIKVHVNKKTGEHYLRVQDFKNLFDVSKIEYSEIVQLENNSLSVTFYDKDKKQLFPKPPKK